MRKLNGSKLRPSVRSSCPTSGGSGPALNSHRVELIAHLLSTQSLSRHSSNESERSICGSW